MLGIAFALAKAGFAAGFAPLVSELLAFAFVALSSCSGSPIGIVIVHGHSLVAGQQPLAQTVVHTVNRQPARQAKQETRGRFSCS